MAGAAGTLQLRLSPSSPEKLVAPGTPSTISTHAGGDLSRSPKESPPTVKKKLCRLFSGIVDGNVTNVDGALEALILAGTLPEHRSTHKPRSNRTMRSASQRSSSLSSAGTGSILRKCNAQNARKNVHFNQDVTVFYISNEGNNFCSDCQSLKKEDPYLDQLHANYKRGQVSFATKTPTVVYDSPPSPPDCTTTGGNVSHATVDSSEVNFTFVEDSVRGMMLKFVIPLGRDYRPEDIVVKANVSGSRVRLVANKRVQNADGSVRTDQVSRRYMLPMDVDPYLVTARLDIRGNLTVEAPLLTLARRDVLKKPEAPKAKLESIPV